MIHRTIRKHLTLAIGLAAGAFAWSTAAAAAPQALGLVATNLPVDLTCEGGVCEAEFSAFCLQAERVAPKPGTPYRLTESSHIVLTGIADDGTTRPLPAGDLLRIQSARSHTAVRLQVDRDRLSELGLKAVRVAVADNVTLTPEPVADDAQPLGEAETSMVEQALRPLGAMVVDQNSEGMAAARIANRLVNSVPYYDGDPQGTAKTWSRLITEARGDGLSPMGERLAQNAFDLCQYYATRVVEGDMKGCMQGQHDRLMKVLNSSYWKAVKTGS